MSSLLDDMQKRFKPRQMSIVEFAESDEFCGKPLYPIQRVLLKLMFLEEMEGWEEDILTWWTQGGRNNEVLISPDIRKRRDWCREEEYSHFTEIDLVGGRRSSKGYVTGLAGTYKLWLTRDIPDPAAFFNMDIDKQIDFNCIAAAFDQAKTRQFADFYSSINRCAALQPFISKRQEEVITIKADTDIALVNEMKRKRVKIARDFAKFRVLPLAANADTLRGSASILTVFDEMAFMMPGESRSSAQECYTAAEPSLAQFGHHALVFCNSSPYSRVGQFYEQYALSMRPEGHKDGWYPMRFAFEFPSWALFDKWWLDPSRKRTSVLMVSPNWPDQLEPGNPDSNLDKKNLGMREAEKLKEKANPDTYKVEYRAQWAEVLDAYLNPDMVNLAYSPILPDGRLSERTDGGTYIHNPYMAHCDPASTTAGFGFALAHVEEFPADPAQWPGGVARHVVFDRVHRWNPQDFPGGTINYLTVQEELALLINLYRPDSLTFDQYNSVGLIQGLQQDTRKMGISNCRIHVVNATANVNWNRWEAFKTALNLGLVHIPPDCLTKVGTPEEFDHSEYSKQELKFLQKVATGQTFRVDKQDLGPIQTKDIADCIAEVTLKFLGSYLEAFSTRSLGESHVVTGAEGGYPIGGRHHGGPMGQEQPGGRQGSRTGQGRFASLYGGFAGHQGGFNPSRGMDPFRRRG